MFCSLRISNDKRVARSLCHSRATCQDSTTFEVNVTACDLEKSFIFDNEAKLQATCTFQLMSKHIVVKSRLIYELLPRFHKTKLTFKLTQGHRQSCHLIAIYDFLFVFHRNYVPILHRFRDIIAYFRNLKTSCDRNHSRDSL